MVKVLSVASVLALAGAASATPFRALTYEAGGGIPGVVGGGFNVSSQGFFDPDGFGGFGAGDANRGGAALSGASHTPTNAFEFDSYFTLDSFGPSARNTIGTANDSVTTMNFYGNYPAASYTASAGTVSAPRSHVGRLHDGNGVELPAVGGPDPFLSARAGFAGGVPNTPSGFSPNQGGGRSTNDGVFIGRFTIPAGATLSATGVLFNVVVSVGIFTGFVLDLDGPAVAGLTDTGVQLLKMESYLVANHAADSTVALTTGFADQSILSTFAFGAAKTIDVWVHTVIPTPGALALLGIGGLVTMRRRRA